jgi:transposase
MARPYSEDIRERVVARVEAGASRREAAEQFDICASTAIKWMQRVEETGGCAPLPTGGSVSPLDAHEAELRALIAETPDMTLDETVAEMRRRKLPGSRSALFRFLDRHKITFKKNSARSRARAA